MADASNVLIVRHLPAELSREDKEDLLKHFGAERVKCFGESGRMKHVTFASFPDHDTAKAALQCLHQLEVMDRRLTAEFSNKQLQNYHPSICNPQSSRKLHGDDIAKVDNSRELGMSKKKREIIRHIHSSSAKPGLSYPSNPRLQYSYPSPTVGILTNIANALASVPKFYVQVLHLMNKMNLPAPFGPVTPTPPVPEGAPPLPPGEPSERPAEPEEGMDLSSGPESELDSEEERFKHPEGRKQHKRPASDMNKPRKKHKLQKILPGVTRPEFVENLARAEHFFEQPQAPPPKKIELKLPSAISRSLASANIDITSSTSAQEPKVDDYQQSDSQTAGNSERLVQVEQPVIPDLYDVPESEPSVPAAGGFGKIEPVPQEAQQNSSSEEEDAEWGTSGFISTRRLAKGKISSSEMKELNVFKKYAAGDPTTRLYIKNLAKQTSEKDLHYIFGRYVEWKDDTEKLMFDIRLMKEGRMKGQAFVTLPKDTRAKDAVKETNGFVLHDKPMVVQFARSAKAKETTADN